MLGEGGHMKFSEDELNRMRRHVKRELTFLPGEELNNLLQGTQLGRHNILPHLCEYASESIERLGRGDPGIGNEIAAKARRNLRATGLGAKEIEALLSATDKWTSSLLKASSPETGAARGR